MSLLWNYAVWHSQSTLFLGSSEKADIDTYIQKLTKQLSRTSTKLFTGCKFPDVIKYLASDWPIRTKRYPTTYKSAGVCNPVIPAHISLCNVGGHDMLWRVANTERCPFLSQLKPQPGASWISPKGMARIRTVTIQGKQREHTNKNRNSNRSNNNNCNRVN